MASAVQVAGCIFCGSPDLTEEHMIPDWVARAFERRRQPGPNLGGTFVARDQMRVQAQPPPATAKVVCRCCNNNWLSVIDNAASAVLKPLIRGNSAVKLDRQAQLAFATWLFKIALVFDAMDAGDEGRLAVQRKPFFELREPPSGPLIYAGPAPAIPWTVPGIPEVAGMRLFGLRPLDGLLNVNLRVANADGTPAEQPAAPIRIPIPGYQIMLGGLFAYMCSRIKFFNVSDDYVQIWPIVADVVEIAVD
jgi:hypothetical protein